LQEKPETTWKDVSDKVQIKKVVAAELLQLKDLGFLSRNVSNHMAKDVRYSNSGQVYNKLVGPDDYVLLDIVAPLKGNECCALSRGGPRENTHFDPKDVKVAIVNCGGLCPGLNDIILHLVNTLSSQYGVQTIYGIRGGYLGLSQAADLPTISLHGASSVQGGSDFASVLLTPQGVKGIQHEGGTILGSARGGFDEERACMFLAERGVNQIYIIGGDGTHRGAYKLSQACLRRGMEVAVAGIPKTIDNDIGLIDRSFGFNSAVEAAQDALKAAKIEAMGNMPNGIVVVKLMGRSAGFLAAHATISNADVDLCLLPESPVILEGEKSCLRHLENVVAKKGHAVVVVAEGAGEDVLGESAETDAGGNKKLPQIGSFMQAKIKEHFAMLGKDATVKYIEPSYMVRSVPANAADSYLCYLLAANAVHGAMAGYTGFTSGFVNNHSVLIPIPLICDKSPSQMNCVSGRTWQRVLAVTGQPH